MNSSSLDTANPPTKKVLIVDSQEMVRSLLCRMLKSWGLACHPAPDVVSACQDVVILFVVDAHGAHQADLTPNSSDTQSRNVLSSPPGSLRMYSASAALSAKRVLSREGGSLRSASCTAYL